MEQYHVDEKLKREEKRASYLRTINSVNIQPESVLLETGYDSYDQDMV